MRSQLEGRDGTIVEASSDGEILVKGDRWAAAVDRGDAYIFSSQDADINATDTMLCLRNDDQNRVLVIDRIAICNGDAATRYEVHLVTAAYTAAGTAVVGINCNPAYADMVNGNGATCYGDETGNTQGSVFLDIGAGVAVVSYGPYPIGLKLRAGTAVGIDQVSESAAGAATIYAYFEDA